MKTNLLLSLCIPTFNRIDKVLYLLSIIEQQMVGLENDIEVIVSDNHTESGSLQKLIDYSKEKNFFKLYLQKENTGFSGNYHFLIEKATGKYTWIFGDDDIITEGALKHIVDILRKNAGKIGCLHLRYNHYDGYVNNVLPPLYDNGNTYGFISNIEDYFLKYSKKGLTSRFLFISINIFYSEILKSILIPKERRDLSDCLQYSLICAKHGLYLDEYISVTQNMTKNSTSWRSAIKDVILYTTPSAIISIPDSYYSHMLKKQIIFNRFKNTYYPLYYLLKMTSQRNIIFFNSLFNMSEKIRIYINNIVYIIKKIYIRCVK